jgi:hypothetical protein
MAGQLPTGRATAKRRQRKRQGLHVQSSRHHINPGCQLSQPQHYYMFRKQHSSPAQRTGELPHVDARGREHDKQIGVAATCASSKTTARHVRFCT